MPEEQDNKVSTDARYIASNLAVPARQAIEAAEKDTKSRHMHKPFGKFFPGAHAWYVRKYGAEAAGAAAAVSEAKNQLKQNSAQNLDDAYLADLIETEAQRAERARLYEESNIGSVSDNSMFLGGVISVIGLAVLFAVAPLIGIALFYAGILAAAIGIGIDEKKGTGFAKQSNIVGEAARKEFEQLREQGKSQLEAIDIVRDKGKGQKIADAKEKAPEMAYHPALEAKKEKAPAIPGGLAEKELQRRAARESQKQQDNSHTL